MTPTPFENEVRRRLEALADHMPTEPTHRPDQAARPGSDPATGPGAAAATGDTSTGRRPRLVAAAVLALVAGLTALTLARPGDRPGEVAAIDPAPNSVPTSAPIPDPTGATPWPDEAGDAWVAVTADPLAERGAASTVWTGRELIRWGGQTAVDSAWADDGAAYDPATDTWRTLAPAPLAPRAYHAAVWTGTVMLVCCGEGAAPQPPSQGPRAVEPSAAAYDPATDRWTSLAPPPVRLAYPVSAWTGDRWLVVGGTTGTTLSYDPSTDTWTELASAPRAVSVAGDAAWSGSQLIVWPDRFGTGPLLSYDPATDRWSTLPDLPAPLQIWGGQMVITGEEVLIWGDLRNSDGQAPEADGQAAGARLRLGETTWRPMADSPLPRYDWWEGTPGSNAAVWTGAEMVVWAGELGGRDGEAVATLAYDPRTDRWRRLPDAAPPLRGPELIWTGDVVLVIGPDILALRPGPSSSMREQTVIRQIGLTLVTLDQSGHEVTVLDLTRWEPQLPVEGLLLRDSYSGATLTARHELILWSDAEGVATVYPGADLRATPRTLETIGGHLVPTPDGSAVWVVRAAPCCEADYDGLGQTRVDRLSLDSGELLSSTLVDGTAAPVSATEAGLVLSATDDVYDEAMDAWVTRPGSARIVTIDSDGQPVDRGPGQVLAAWHQIVAYVDPVTTDLTLWDLDTDVRSQIPSRGDNWITDGGPNWPSTTPPLPTVTDDGRLLVARARGSLDEGTFSGELHLIDLRSAQTVLIADRVPGLAGISPDGAWLIEVDRSDVILTPLNSDEAAIVLPAAIPDGHQLVAVHR